MGRGKGSPSLKIYPLKAGKIIFEIKSVLKGPVIRALRSSALRLPVSTTIVKKYDQRTDNIKGG
jgi:ribosomal protein L16/L10AE